MKKVVGLLLAVAFTSSAAFGGTVSFMNPLSESSGDGTTLVLEQGASGTFEVWVTDSTNNPGGSVGIIVATFSNLMLTDWSFSQTFTDATFTRSFTDIINQIPDATELTAGGASFANDIAFPMMIGTITIMAPADMLLDHYEIFVDFNQEENGVSKIGAQGTDADPLFGSAIVSVVPEPATLALLGLGGIAVLRRRRR